MRWLLTLIVLLLTACRAEAQLPHGIPDFANRPGGCQIVAVGQTYQLPSDTPIPCLQVRGVAVLAHLSTPKVGTLQVMEGGELRTGVDGAIVDYTVLDLPIDTSFDPEQYGAGIVSFGAVHLTGTSKTPFVRLAVEPLAGTTTLTLETAPSGWQAGDRLMLPDTRQSQDVGTQVETLTIKSITGATVTLTAPLAFDHTGARNLDGQLVFLPHVGNITRSIVIRSENPAGTRGHVLFTHHAEVDIQGVEFRDLGRTTVDPLHCTLRTDGTMQSATHCNPGTGPVTQIGTNHIGRYPVHFHHLVPPYVFRGNSVTHSKKWPAAIHNSHFGSFTDNVIFDGQGALVMTEDGNETGNLIARNFAVGSVGQGNRESFGREGTGFYARGPLNIWIGNVAANVRTNNVDSSYGFKIFNTYNQSLKRPKFAGADTTDPAQVDIIDGNRIELAEFRDNEVYGTESGLTAWWLGYGMWFEYWGGPGEKPVAPRSTIGPLRVWHVWNKCVFAYESSQLTYDGLQCYGTNEIGTSGFIAGDYIQEGGLLTNAHIEGMDIGSDLPTITKRQEFRIESSFFRNRRNIAAGTLYTSSSNAYGLHPREATVDRVTFAAPPNQSRSILHFAYQDVPVRHLTQRDQIRFTSVDGVAGDNFEFFAKQQAPEFIVPPTTANCYSVVGAESSRVDVFTCTPVSGLTNAQLWSAHGRAIRGAVLPSTATTREGVDGFVVATGTPPPPPPPVNAVCSEWSEWVYGEWVLSADKKTETTTRTHTRTELSPAANGGTTCEPLSETEPVSRPFVVTAPRLVIVDGEILLELPSGERFRIVFEPVP